MLLNFNTLKTALLLASLSGLLMLLGGLIGGSTGIQLTLILSLALNGFAYFYSDRLVLRMYNAQPLNESTYGWIHEIVRELAHTMNIPQPKLWLIESPVANAFATGRNPQHASVAVTTGILRILTPEELRGVLAHELSHVKNRDILVGTIAATIATAIGYLANMLQYAAFWSSGDRERRTNPIIAFLIALIMPVAAALIQFAISRSREYLADESGAHYCKDPLSLASALEKLDNNVARAHFDSKDTAHASTASLFIVFPFSANGGLLLNLFSTHPPMAQRIARLRKMHDQTLF